LEPGETIENGMKREVKEEAGVECEPLGLISVDAVRPAWYRFTYLAEHTDGNLKTLAQKDSESLQAAWFRVDQLLSGNISPETPLRSLDILRLIRLAFLRRFGDTIAEPPLCHARTIFRPLVGLFVRFVLICENKVLLRRRHFPIAEYALTQDIGAIIVKFVESVTPSTTKSSDVKVISAEALPIPAYKHDGSCLTILIEMAATTIKQHAEDDGYQWVDFANDEDLSNCIELWRNNFAALHL